MDVNEDTLKKDWKETKEDVAEGYDKAIGKAHEVGHEAKDKAEEIGREAKDAFTREAGR